jgi:putative tRNA adenosine deaminase-associated protein
MSEETLVDFAVVIFREDEQWNVGPLPLRAAENLDALVAAVRQQPSEGVALGICSYGDDFFLVVRPHGQDVRLFLSDASAAGEWPIAAQALEAIETEDTEPDDDDAEQAPPAGDLGIFADLGVSSLMLSTICADLELYPDEVVAQIATHIGFGPQFDQAVDAELV